MIEIISVKFRGRGKLYYFDPAGVTANPGDQLVVETSKGMELGTCIIGNHMVQDDDTVQPLRPVVRAATENDLRVAEINRSREAEAFGICKELIAKHKLEMKLVDVECSFEGSKILFFFTADGRVDFRELVKDLAGVFRTRIELRQIGVRDEAKMLGGLGICGRPFCCRQFLGDFQPVSTKMAKTQSMSLNPVKISGTCGRLMCCLRYEQEAYEDLVKHVPKTGTFVQTKDGYGVVTQVNLLRQSVKVRLDGPGDDTVRTYTTDEFAEVPGGRPPEGEPLPQIFHYVAKPKEEPEPDEWAVPMVAEAVSAEAPSSEAQPEGETAPAKKSSGNRRRRNRPKNPAPQKAEKQEKPHAEAPKAPRKASQPRPAQAGRTPEHSGARKNSGSRRRRNNRPRNSGETHSSGEK